MASSYFQQIREKKNRDIQKENGTQCVASSLFPRSKIEKWASYEHSERYLKQLCKNKS